MAIMKGKARETLSLWAFKVQLQHFLLFGLWKLGIRMTEFPKFRQKAEHWQISAEISYNNEGMTNNISPHFLAYFTVL